uniref:EGF-like domain-containing protein n=1 Tax=Paramoeba aestuarina TaxID=180227 RepID=A0A7S4KB95_9EUKA|eukprot:CAMPEP_0201539442 /NCGR_PEP_ID=MMETSP0161_2-20130828/70409_1 /ASSEMBLY_ACC=CAM_ASM_000251 /TAXON_ID=180227 /ORGANISM="Neoparamoeba aestuarina, Strain SoJaBio B1-5/56/2" /LENGTH=465 /DNA_ID=CAMNT_0047946839 /DNA_START=72 /DNA_END=1469 /DNA_ORIENTATION=+
MKFFLLFCAVVAVVVCDTVVVEQIRFDFDNTDGVATQTFTLPFNYAGSINISLDDSPESDVLLCLHWVVPVVAPYGEDVDLGSIWEKTCTSYWPVNVGDPFKETGVILRSGEYYFSAAVNNVDIDSTGIITGRDYDFSVNIVYTKCNDNMFGDTCTLPYSPLSYTEDTSMTVGSTPIYFTLPTLDITDTNTFDLFASSLNFDFDTMAPEGVEFTMLYRLEGSPQDGVNDGKECRSSTSCTIKNPPFTATPGFTWGLSISASEETNTTVSVSFRFCDSGEIGSDCEDYQTLDTDVGEVKKYSKKTVLVFDSSVSVAVGGLDGYEQQSVAPPVKVQIDAEPLPESEYDILLSEGAEANVAIIDMTGISADSKIVLSIDPSKSFGIWKVDGTTHCPNGCANHGTCSSQEYVCECDDKYEDLDCGHEIKDFTIEYIILIAVGSILILAILIGVPIYCYLNRNQEYDIVA